MPDLKAGRPTLGVPRPKEVQSSLRGRLRLIYSRNLLPRWPLRASNLLYDDHI